MSIVTISWKPIGFWTTEGEGYSGLLNTTQQLGGAIGVAVASTVAAAHTKTLLHGGDTAATALSGGFQWAFWVCGATALLAIPITFLLMRRDELARALATNAEAALAAS